MCKKSPKINALNQPKWGGAILGARINVIFRFCLDLKMDFAILYENQSKNAISAYTSREENSLGTVRTRAGLVSEKTTFSLIFRSKSLIFGPGRGVI
jgi:hypothetical protein